jgi:hypothetical protein
MSSLLKEPIAAQHCEPLMITIAFAYPTEPGQPCGQSLDVFLD